MKKWALFEALWYLKLQFKITPFNHGDCLHKLIKWPQFQIKERQISTPPTLPSSAIGMEFTSSPLRGTQSSHSSCQSSFEHIMEGLREFDHRRPYVHKI